MQMEQLNLAIGRALDIREQLDRFCRQYRPKDPTDSLLKDDLLSRMPWHQLDRPDDCLKVFEVSMLCTEGRNSFYFDWFPTLELSAVCSLQIVRCTVASHD